MSTWYIKYNNQKRPLSDWGIIKPILKLRNQQVGTLEFSIAPDNINDDPVFPYDAILHLYQDNVRRFRGRVTSLPVEGKASADRNKYVVSDPWWELDNVVYLEYVNVPDDITRSNSSLHQILISRVILFQTILSNGSSVRCTNGAQIGKVLAFGASKIASSNAIQIGTIDPAITPPYEESHDLMCSEVLRRCLRWSPDSVCYFDYTTADPTINFRSRGALSATNIDLNVADLVTSWSCGARYDLRPSGVTIFLQNEKMRTDGVIWNNYNPISAGDVSTSLRQIVMTVPLDSTDTNKTDLANLATQYWNSVKTLQYAGDIEIRESEPTFSLVPGKLLNLSNARTEFATMNAVIQTCEIDIEVGITKASFGPPDQLGRQDLLELIRNARLGGDSTGLSSTGPSGVSSGYNSGGDMVSLQVCDTTTGTSKTISVKSFGSPSLV